MRVTPVGLATPSCPQAVRPSGMPKCTYESEAVFTDPSIMAIPPGLVERGWNVHPGTTTFCTTAYDYGSEGMIH
jgi:hypothetical protein